MALQLHILIDYLVNKAVSLKINNLSERYCQLAVIRHDNSCTDIVESLSTVSIQAKVFDTITLARSHLGVSLVGVYVY